MTDIPMTQKERAEKWRRIAREESSRHEAERMTSAEDNCRVLTALLRSVRHSIRTPEMASITDHAEFVELTIAEVVKLFDLGEAGEESSPAFIRAMDQLRKLT
jgi:K+-sensing histidine kinase KdpD